MSQDKTTKIQRKFKGIVVGTKMDKTIVVAVESTKVHPKYHKQYTVTTKYKVHDEYNEYTVGEKVVFYECRPISKHKRWRVTRKLEKK